MPQAQSRPSFQNRFQDGINIMSVDPNQRRRTRRPSYRPGARRRGRGPGIRMPEPQC